MIIKSIKIEGLFDTFNHTINLNDEGITILLGENGIGKTATLEVINDFFNFKFNGLIEREFEKLSLKFSNNEEYVISKVLGRLFIKKVTKVKNIWYDFTTIERTDLDKYLNTQSETSFEEMVRAYYEKTVHSNVEKNIKSLKDKGLIDKYVGEKFIDGSRVDHWINIYERKKHQKDDGSTSISKFSQLMTPQILDGEIHYDKEKIPSWFYKMISGVNSKLIETQRIITIDKEANTRSTVRVCCDNLKSEFSKATYRANAVSSKLDSSFPNRLMVALRRRKVEELDEISGLLKKLDENRRLYSAVGILGDVNKNELELFKHDAKKEDNKSILNMISLYIEDSNEKLEPYKELYSKLELFLRLINSRLRHKKILACRKEGLSIVSLVKNHNGIYTSDEKISIPIEKLSSGEQHEIILFFKLIFNQPDGSMVLIDEPELSLHISWQNEFINDLREIIKLKNLSVVIATHSPDIIGSHWGLTQELSGPSDR
ncbi:AAA family ATPase [Enterovibrio norvegicus]|uniref:AAA family ATPase n=1 Tax=Enterovibrio norvegicus TaxID=188144 RepID=A0ABV4L376_9GAMM